MLALFLSMTWSWQCQCQYSEGAPEITVGKRPLPGAIVSAAVAVQGAAQAPASYQLLARETTVSSSQSPAPRPCAGDATPKPAAAAGASGYGSGASPGTEAAAALSPILPRGPSLETAPGWSLQGGGSQQTPGLGDARTFSADVDLPMLGPAVRVGEVWQVLPDAGCNLEKVTLSLHANGFSIERDDTHRTVDSISWSPFGLVQACRLHSAQADKDAPCSRLFKITVLQCGSTFFFAVQGAQVLTQSLFPFFRLSTQPLSNVTWTATRLLAGYMLLLNKQDVALIYCELRSHWDSQAAIIGYEDAECLARVLHIDLSVPTCISERVGVDSSCFSIDGYNLSVRSCAEKNLWLRAINNVKVKLRHSAANPSPYDLGAYRSAIWEYAGRLPTHKESHHPLLPLRQRQQPAASTPNKGVGSSSVSLVHREINLEAFNSSEEVWGHTPAPTPVARPACPTPSPLDLSATKPVADKSPTRICVMGERLSL